MFAFFSGLAVMAEAGAECGSYQLAYHHETPAKHCQSKGGLMLKDRQFLDLTAVALA